MAGRIRTIKPELLDDERAAELSDAAWRLFVSSWLLADDHGNFRAGGKYLAAQVWQDTSRDADGPLAELARSGRVELYEVDGQRYAHIPTWRRHQRIDNAGKPRVPVPTDTNRILSDRFAEIRGESREVAATLGKSPLDLRPPTSDLRPPTTDHRPPTTHLRPPTSSSTPLASPCIAAKIPPCKSRLKYPIIPSRSPGNLQTSLPARCGSTPARPRSRAAWSGRARAC